VYPYESCYQCGRRLARPVTCPRCQNDFCCDSCLLRHRVVYGHHSWQGLIVLVLVVALSTACTLTAAALSFLSRL
jgi:hypothetical protein